MTKDQMRLSILLKISTNGLKLAHIARHLTNRQGGVVSRSYVWQVLNAVCDASEARLCEINTVVDRLAAERQEQIARFGIAAK